MLLLMEKFFKGIPGSGKIAFGSALVFIKSNIIIPKYSISPGGNSIENEIEKLESALLKTRNQLEALKLDPYNAKIHYHLGVYYAERGELKKAFDHYSKALQ